MAIEVGFDRALVNQTPGAFLSFGVGSDVDGAFDDAVMSDRFDLGVSSGVPSLAAVDSSASRDDFALPVHPHAAISKALELVAQAAPGALYAVALSPLKEFAHRTVNVTLEDPSLALPAMPGPLWLEPDLMRAACNLADLAPEEEVVSGSIARRWSEKFKAAAVPASGPRRSQFMVCPVDSWESLGIFESASLARRFALTLARSKGAGPGAWRIVPIVRRGDGDGFALVERQRVTCKVPVKLLVARRKDAAKATVQGWLFAGILPSQEVDSASGAP